MESDKPVAIGATLRRVARPRGKLSAKTLRTLATERDRLDFAESAYRRVVLAALEEGSFSEVSRATGLSTNTLQRWKREAGR